MLLKTSISKAQRKTILTVGTPKITTMSFISKWWEREFLTLAVDYITTGTV